jgi:hypothetical protein
MSIPELSPCPNIPSTHLIVSWRVYLLRCSDDSLYCGVTTDVDRRLHVHNKGAPLYNVQAACESGLVISRVDLVRRIQRRLPDQAIE